jgi:hypothetical protein
MIAHQAAERQADGQPTLTDERWKSDVIEEIALVV